MVFLTFLVCFASLTASAQMKEVRGIQTRVVEYTGDKVIQYGSKAYEWAYNIHGFEIKNTNSYTVWVEVALCASGVNNRSATVMTVQPGTYDTKSLTLKPGETYVWKCGDKMLHYLNNYHGKARYEDLYDQFFVSYKAYKAE